MTMLFRNIPVNQKEWIRYDVGTYTNNNHWDPRIIEIGSEVWIPAIHEVENY